MGLIILIIILSLLSVTFVVIISVDVIVKYNRRRLKKQIRVFSDFESWKNAVFECSKKWARKMPTVPLTDHDRFVLLDMVRGQYKHNSLQCWQYTQLICGIKAIAPESVIKATDQFDIKEIDEGFALYKQWRAELFDENDIEKYMQTYLSVLEKRTKENGLIEYRAGFGDVCIADTLAFVSPLLIKYGVYKNNNELIDSAMLQINSFYNYGYIDKYGLYAHGYNAVKKAPCESIGWGRGTGWFLFGILNCYEELPDNSEYKAILLERIEEALNNILCYQRADGGWSTQLVGNWNYDSSATAMFALYILRASKIVGRSSKYTNAVERAVEKLMTVTTKSGALMYCEGDCHGIGKYSKLYTISPFTQGVVLEVITEYERMKNNRNE